MGSMKRIDVLKGIESILVQKTYETGHISHRAGGDCQKQADGSWKPYAGLSTSQTQEPAPTENTKYGEITEEDLEELDKKELSQHLSNMHNQTIQSLLNDLENGKITEDQFKSQMSDLNNNITTSLNSLDSDERVKMSPKQLTRHLLKNGDYDSAIRQIDFEEDDDGVPFTYDNDFELIVDNVMNDMDMSDEERKVNRGAVSRAIMDRALQLRKPAEYDEVQKSVVRNMRSAPTTKNMGF